MPAVIDAAQVEERATDLGDTARVRITIDRDVGSEDLEQRLIRFLPGRSHPRGPGHEWEEALFALSGSGSVIVDGSAHAFAPEHALYVAAGERYEVENPGPHECAFVSVSAPASSDDALAARRRVAVGLADQEAHDATTQREFRYLVHPGIGCPSMTQFVGYIPTVRAPTHYHRYDEVIYVLEGEGRAHIGDTAERMSAGTCIHLPPRQPHCLENTGAEPMRVLGVFRPAGDPSEAYEA